MFLRNGDTEFTGRGTKKRNGEGRFLVVAPPHRKYQKKEERLKRNENYSIKRKIVGKHG